MAEAAGPATRRAGAAGPIDAAGPELAQLLVVGLWSSTFVVSKAVFAVLPPLPFTAARFAIMLALAFGVLLLRGRGRPPPIRRADRGRFLAVAATGYTLYQLCFVLGLERTSPFSSSLLVALVPLFTVLILALLGERTPPPGWLGIGIAVVGVAIFLWDKRGDTGSLAGDALSLGAGVAFALYGVLNRPLVGRYPPAVYSAWTILLGAAPLLVLAVPQVRQTDWAALPPPIWLAVAYMAIFPVYVAYQLWNWAIARRGAAVATTFSLLVPIASGVLSALVFGERFGPWKLVGAALVLTGLVVVRLPAGALVRWRMRREGEG